ncbi:MAG: hypothetical protein MZW92_47930 [Comamonadaceae bacterium]|nr:hypothetical protein [Comamonadaceae bacterium]
MFLPPVSATSYRPPTRLGELRAVAAGAPVREAQRRESRPGLDADELQLLQQMRARDRELRVLNGRRCCLAAPRCGPFSYTYERGPDGDFYAVDGIEGSTSAERRCSSPALDLPRH